MWFALVVGVRHGDVVSPWKMSPSWLTKDNNSKELKYNQTQPNSTEPKGFRPGQSNRPGVDVRPTVGGSPSPDVNQQKTICAEELWNGSERKWRPRGCWEGARPTDAADATRAPRISIKEQSPYWSDHSVGRQIVLQLHVMFATPRTKPATQSPVSPEPVPSVHAPLQTPVSLVFGVDFLIEEVLRQQVELAVLFSDSVRPDELELLQCKLVELILHLPDGWLLQLGNGLFCGWLFLTGLPQVGFLPCNGKRRRITTI